MERKSPTVWAGLSAGPQHSWGGISGGSSLLFPFQTRSLQIKSGPCPCLSAGLGIQGGVSGRLWAADRQRQHGGSALRCGVLTSTHPSMLPALCFWFFGFAVVGAFWVFCLFVFSRLQPWCDPYHTPHTHPPLPSGYTPTPLRPSTTVRPVSSGPLSGRPLPTLCGPWCVGGINEAQMQDS